MPVIQGALNLRALLNHKCLCMPGAFNGLGRLLLETAGFEAGYISGAALSASRGLPDIGLLSREEMCSDIAAITHNSKIPFIADADTGFGDTKEAVYKTVKAYIASGTAGLHIEDQEFPKRCGHLPGKRLLDLNTCSDKIEAAVAASRNLSDGSFIICARTDARGVTDLEDAIRRAQRYLDVGADMIFPEGLRSEDEFKTFASKIRQTHPKALLLANMTEFGVTPTLSIRTFATAGYNAVIFPVSTLRISVKPIQELLRKLRNEGILEQSTIDSMLTREDLYSLIDYKYK